MTENEIITVTFTCRACDSPAATIHLSCSQVYDSKTISLSGFWQESATILNQETWAKVREALKNESADALHRIDPFQAPFYCAECGSSYCSKHWIIEEPYANEYPISRDTAIGTCPNNHRRVMVE